MDPAASQPLNDLGGGGGSNLELLDVGRIDSVLDQLGHQQRPDLLLLLSLIATDSQG